MAVGAGVWVAVGAGVTVGVGDEVAVAVGCGVAVEVGAAVAVGEGVAVGVLLKMSKVESDVTSGIGEGVVRTAVCSGVWVGVADAAGVAVASGSGMVLHAIVSAPTNASSAAAMRMGKPTLLDSPDGLNF
ncbi:MAG: hypothetical protein L0177_18690 [Chloroflexi bacterium]|nr:hypothetical protein [Chloroflexota bacterium]